MDYTKKIVYQSNYWYNDGLRKAKARDMSGAVVSLRRSLQFNRENIAARNLLGLVYYGIGEVPEALVEWIISKNLRPRDNIADYYIKNVQASAAELETINLAIRKFNQCLAYCRQNGEDLAVIQLKQVIASHPTYLKAYQLLALIYLHTGQYMRARQVLKEARKLDTSNEMTMRYMRELMQKRGKRRYRNEKKKDDAVEYSYGNETIIQPKHSRLRELSAHLAIANIFIGAFIGAAIIWFLVAPAVNQTNSQRMNDQMREYSDQIKSLEAQISAQTRTLDNYRAAAEDREANVEKAQATSDSYETLLSVAEQYSSGQSSYASMADTLLSLDKSMLGAKGLERYDELTSQIYPGACSSNFNTGTASLQSGDYDAAVESLYKVVQMDEDFYDGLALYNLGQAYMEKGDNENASAYFSKIVESYGDSAYAQQAQDKLDTINGSSSEDSAKTE